MASGRSIVITLISVCYLCVIGCLADPVTFYSIYDVDVGQTQPRELYCYTSFDKPTDIWFTITYDNTKVEISSITFPEDSDNSRITSQVERLTGNKIQIKVSESNDFSFTLANVIFKGIGPGPTKVTIDYQRYGYYQGTTFVDRLSEAYPEEYSFAVYKPYVKSTLPCRIEAENYDYGPNGFSYFDTTAGNTGGAYRSDDVDISQIPGGGYNIGYIADGEWLMYTIDVPAAYFDGGDLQNVQLRVASWKDGCKIKIISDYDEKIVDIGNTQNEWKIIQTKINIAYSDWLKIEFIGTGQILDYIDFIKLKPDAFFKISQFEINTPTTVTFTDESLNFPTSWTWSFGDGSVSNEQNPSHVYTQQGRYPVTLTVTNSEGSSTVQKMVYYLSPLPTQPIKVGSADNFDYSVYNKSTVYLNEDGLYRYDFTTDTTTYIFTFTTPDAFVYNDNWIVWTDEEWDSLNGESISNVYLYDIQKEQETQLTSSYYATNPSLSGNKVVYQDIRNGNYDIFLYDIASRTESFICSESHDQTNPVIEGNNVVWQDYRLGHQRIISMGSDGMGGTDYSYDPTSNIYQYSLTTGTGGFLSDIDAHQAYPQISGNRVVWLDDRNGRSNSESGHLTYFDDIYMFDNLDNEESAIKANFDDEKEGFTQDYSYVTIQSDTIVWVEEDNFALGILNFETNQEYKISGGYIREFIDNKIFYEGSDGDVYLLTLPGPVPSTIPGGSGLPQDLNNDGKYEDVNGNGREDFADIVLLFNQMSWIAENEPLTAFDYNNNGRLDFADVVALFNGLGSPTTNLTTVQTTIPDTFLIPTTVSKTPTPLPPTTVAKTPTPVTTMPLPFPIF